MKNQSSENYLDQLLSEIEDGDVNPEMDLSEVVESVPLDDFEKELFGGPSEDSAAKGARSEEDFLREFETEFKDDKNLDFDGGLMQDFDATSADEAEDAADASIDDMISHMDAFDGSGEDMAADISEDSAGGNTEIIPEEMPLGEEGEVDLSGMSGNDLLDILAGAEDLSDLGDMLSADSSGTEISGAGDFDQFAEEELKAQQEQAEAAEDDGGKKKRKRKKKEKDGRSEGFMKRLGRVLFGEDEPEEQVVSLSASDTVDVNELSAENQQILKEMENAGADELPGKKGKKKKDKKEKKEKKENKPKEPKPKKEKKPKEPKPKKEKKPKEKDNTPPLPKGPVIAIVIMVGSLLGLVIVGTRLMGYQSNVSQAKELYGQGAYADAYEQLSGLPVREKDSKLYNQLAALAPVSSEYNTYLVFSNAGKNDMALDALICAFGRYNVNLESARENDCLGEMEDLGGRITQALLEDYDMTGDEALELYNLRTRREYTIQMHSRLRALGLE